MAKIQRPYEWRKALKIEKIFIEDSIKNSLISNQLPLKFPKATVQIIENYADIWGRVKKPYLQKRDSLNLFIARKQGQLVKEAPNAYGISGEPHYYFIHAYNCIYECDYCYLQGYFNTPDLVLFVNHEEIISEMQKIAEQSDENMWFHAGEFSDSLALTHLTGELDYYHKFTKKNPHCYIELRTKSANIKELLKLEPLPNFITSFSLSPKNKIKSHDLKTPSLAARLKAIKSLYEAGHPIGIHFDPVIHSESFESEYEELISELSSVIPLSKVEYISIGVVRFTKDVYSQVKKNYPQTTYFHSELTKGEDGKIRYPRPMRMWILGKIKDLCLKAGASKKSTYLCMEE